MSRYKFTLQDSESEAEDRIDYSFSSKQELYESPRKSRRPIYLSVFAIIAISIGLGVGLGVGLQKRDCDSSSGGSVSSNEQQQQHGKTSQQPSSSSSNIVSTTERANPNLPQTTPKVTKTTESVQQTTPKVRRWIDEPCIPPDDSPICPWSEMPLLLVSLDGFRAEYLTRNITPTIEKLSRCGVQTPYMRSVYPTLTFPNHYSIVTGLYPESHGLVDNNMYDDKINATFHLFTSEKSNPAWYQGEPIWITAQKQGKKSASYFWVGSDVNISGHYPDTWNAYDGSVTFEKRVDTVLEWLSLPANKRPDLLLLYFDEPDHTGHGSGPDSPEVNSMLGRVDTIISRLMDGLVQRNLHNCVNLMILADHGMEKTSCGRRVFLNRYIDVKKYLIFDGTIGNIHKDYYEKKVGKNYIVKKNDTALPLNKLMKSLNCKSGHLQMYTKSTLPIRHHYTNSDRIGETIIDVQAQWMVAKDKHTYCLQGNHGFDNLYKSMQALFLAHGPGFKQNYTAAPFENIELYNVMSELLNITAAPNNGTKGALNHILKKTPTTGTPSYSVYRTCPVMSQQKVSHLTSDACLCQNLSSAVTYTSNSIDLLPFGEPKQLQQTESCVLHNKEYVAAYSHDHKMPLWSTFVLKPTQKVTLSTEKLCVVHDQRLPVTNTTCHSYGSTNASISYTHLYNPGFGSQNNFKQETQLSSNLVPMYTGFKEGLWKYSWRIISDFAKQPGHLSATVGPAFDYNTDGLFDGQIKETQYVDDAGTVPLPTHFYIVLMRCEVSTVTTLAACPKDKIDILSFILPHKQDVPNCMPEEEFLRENVARIRDVELLTGFQFLTKLDVATAARKRTYLPTSLWSTSKIAYSWKDLPCEDASHATCPGKVPLLLISLDGFRAEYLKRKLTPVIQKMRDCGVHTPYMRSVYPTVTFPNHYTIVTGLYPESHGIISNNMYDKDIGEVFSISSRTKMDPRWWHGEPMWITAKKQNKKTATFFWPGSDVNISGIYPDIWKAYDGSVGFPERVSTVIDWLTLPDAERPDFITLYFDEPDHAGHQSGPDSDGVNDQLKTVDDMLSRLMDALYHRGLHNCVNIIVIADHGFDYTSCSQLVKLPKYMPDIKELLIFDGTFGRIERDFKRYSKYNVTTNKVVRPVQGIVDELMCKNDAMKVFTKETIPKRLHYSYNPRMGEILLDIKDKWLVTDTNSFFCTGGNHGWDNLYKTMHALFLAHGPGFKQQVQIEPFENIELYNLMAELLEVNPAGNNGTWGSLHHILQNPKLLKSDVTSKDTNMCSVGSSRTDVLQVACGCQGIQNLKSSDVISGNYTKETVDMITPLGAPISTANQSEYCTLHYPNMLTGYSSSLDIPIWTSFILTEKQITECHSTGNTDLCVMNDPRMSPASCGDFNNEKSNITLSRLYDPKLVRPESGSNVHFMSNAVPMFKNFKLGIWNTTWELLRQYTLKYNKISVTVGPVFDKNGDGLVDQSHANISFVGNSSIPIPTHFFITTSKCKVTGEDLPCHTGGVDVQSFIIPHTDQIPNCLQKTEYLQDNVARVRDIELITGLKFFSQKYNVSTAARMATYLPVTLWSASLFQKWIDTSCPAVEETCDSGYKPLLLISLDGFRADYLVRNFTPYIRRLSQCGVHAKYMRSVYPTKTFPNHYSIATGLYPESHGIIDNNMYDPKIGEKFSMSSANASDPRWWGGEPIWNTAVKHNKTAATFFWPGSEYEIGGMRPNIYKKYDGSVTFDGRVDTVLSWMDLPQNKRPELMTLYFDEPDHTGHSYGPDNIAMIGHALARVDEAIGRLMEGLFKRNLHNCVNVIIIADHGFSDTSCDRLIGFRDYLDTYNMYMYEGAFGRINPNFKYARKGLGTVKDPEPVANITAKLTCQSPHFKVYQKPELPVRHHYAYNDRIDPIIVDVEDTWLVTFRNVKGYKSQYCKGGNHGYDNIYKSMRALFLAHGPAFRKNLSVDEFENIELYNLMTEILNITGAPNNGTMGSLNHLLKNPPSIVPQPASVQYSSEQQHVSVQDILQVIDTDQCKKACSFLPAKRYEIGSLVYLSSLMMTYQSSHLLYGMPAVQLTDKSVTMRVLYQPSFVTGYRNDLKVPLWIGYTIHNSIAQVERVPTPTDSSCVIPDLRVDSQVVSQQKCTFNQNLANETYTWTSLVARALLDSETELSHLSSTYVPMLTAFKTGIWEELHKKVYAWSRKFKNINIMTGPVYDHNIDGRADTLDQINSHSVGGVAIPTHFYMVITRCNRAVSNGGVCEDPTSLSFILPHRPDVTNCQTVDQYLRDNEARVRDVEWITGLDFYTNMLVDKAIQLRTYLPSGPWPV